MSGTVRYAKLDSPTSRARLKRGRQPHWHTLVRGRAHLGFQRWPGTAPGRWVLRRLVDGRYQVTALGTEAELDFNAAKEKAEKLNGATTIAGRLTVRAAAAFYIERQAAKGRDTKATEARIANHITLPLGEVEVTKLTTERIYAWLAEMAPVDPDPERRRRRQATANRVLAILKAILNLAFVSGRVGSNAAWAGKRVEPFAGAGAARLRYLTIDESQRLLNAADEHLRPLVRAALETGCRYGELTRLEVRDFNPDAGTLVIRHSKSGKSRHVILTGDGEDFFRQVCLGRPGDAPMFTRDGTLPWRPCDQSKPMSDAVERARLVPKATFHSLRHTWASLSIMNGVPLIVVARNLGHADTKMVERHYGHLADSFVTDAIRKGAPRFGPVEEGVVSPIRR
jgi:integrase